jgi:hypothetical protein
VHARPHARAKRACSVCALPLHVCVRTRIMFAQSRASVCLCLRIHARLHTGACVRCVSTLCARGPCMFVCMCVYVSCCAQLCTHCPCMFLCACARMHAQVFVCARVCMRAFALARTRVSACPHEKQRVCFLCAFRLRVCVHMIC